VSIERYYYNKGKSLSVSIEAIKEDQETMSTNQQLPSVTNPASPSGGKPDRICKHPWCVAIKAYGGSLVLTSVAFPIVASVATICFYLAPEFAFPLLAISSKWYAPVYGFLAACITWLLFAVLCFRFATASGAHMHAYMSLKSRHSELKARLGIGDDKCIEQCLSEMQQKLGIVKDDVCRNEALREAYYAYTDLNQILFHNCSGIEWTSRTGYFQAWRIVHRAQEALVEVEPPQEVIADAVRDIRFIQNSALTDSKALIRKMLQAVKDLCPKAMVYFEELRTDKNYTDLFEENVPVQCPHQPPQLSVSSIDPNQKNPGQSDQVAREVVQQVKHSLHAYQDNLRSGLVRWRNIIYIAIALTGFVTYLLLSIVLLWNTTQFAIGTATAYYMIGAVTGLFVLFYNETNNLDAPADDYGLSVARMIATPVLSGLAAIGGVLILATLPTLSGQKVPDMGMIFNGTVTLEYFFAAAIFGYAPNLIIRNLQQRAQKYSTDLRNSQGEGSSKED
jgi:hypothetical protein